jgi:hypothetical protein
VRPPVLQPEAAGPVPSQRFDLDEAPLIEQQLDAFVRGQLALPALASSGFRMRVPPDLLFERQ